MIFLPIPFMAGHRIRGILGVLASLAAFGAPAQEPWSKWDVDFDEDKKPWKEIEARIPSYPMPENLIPFEADKASGHRYFIDARSLARGDDGVMRYVLVIKASGGAASVTFEGIRCESREQKLYAIGQAGGGWTRARNPLWRAIGLKEASRHGALYDEHFCADRFRPATPKQAVQSLKFGSARYSVPANE
jgi:hypothetical protein